MMLAGCAGQSTEDAPLLPSALAIVPEYKSQIDFEDGARREGDVLITARGGAYTLYWEVEKRLRWGGVGVSRDHFLALATAWFPAHFAPSNSRMGVAIYHVRDGVLDGSVFEGRGSVHQRFQERLAGAPSLDGRYKVVSSDAAVQPAYVTITPKKGAYLFARIGISPVVAGVGMRVGDTFIVAYSDYWSPAVAVLCRAGSELVGLRVDSTLEIQSVVLRPRENTGGPAVDDSDCRQSLDTARP